MSSGITLRLANNDYQINNSEWEHAQPPRGPNPTSNIESVGNNSWLESFKRQGNRLFKTYNIVIFLDLEPGKATAMTKLNSRCDARRNKIREIAHKNPVTRRIITFLYGNQSKYKRNITKKKDILLKHLDYLELIVHLEQQILIIHMDMDMVMVIDPDHPRLLHLTQDMEDERKQENINVGKINNIL